MKCLSCAQQQREAIFSVKPSSPMATANSGKKAIFENGMQSNFAKVFPAN